MNAKFARLIGLAVFLLVSSWSANAGIEEQRFQAAASYMKYVSEGEFDKAYVLLSWPISLDEFKTRISAANEGFAKEMKEHGIELISKNIDRVMPMTFEEQYVIVNVMSRVVGKRGDETITDNVNYQMYFRFNSEGKIDLVHAIGEGWIC